jgi:hypothetical protein
VEHGGERLVVEREKIPVLTIYYKTMFPIWSIGKFSIWP